MAQAHKEIFQFMTKANQQETVVRLCVVVVVVVVVVVFVSLLATVPPIKAMRVLHFAVYFSVHLNRTN